MNTIKGEAITRLRSQILKLVIEGKMTQTLAGKKIGISDRQVRNLLKVYKEKGEKGLKHGLSGKKGNRALKRKEEKIIEEIIKDPMCEGFNPILNNREIRRELLSICIKRDNKKQDDKE